MATSIRETGRFVAATGIAGLDDVLGGGLTRNSLYLVEGKPGSGKTTLALQFLREGVAEKERVLYVTLSETERELRAVAQSHHWSLDGVDIREFTSNQAALDPDEQNTMFHPSELELAETTRRIIEDIDRVNPKRLVLDSLSELRMLAGSALRYRRQILALKHLFAKREITVLMLDDITDDSSGFQMQSLAHGVVLLEQLHPEFGAERRRVRVVKYRGMKFRGGYHDYLIRTGGLEVYPRLIAAESRRRVGFRRFKSGIKELDALIGGGLEEGTSTLIVGAAGTGKSTLAAQFMAAAAARGEGSALFAFDESPRMLLSRCRSFHIDLETPAAAGLVQIRQVDPAELTPGELTHSIRAAVENGAKIIVIDSLNGYLNAMPEERHLTIQLHELLMFLGQHGVATILIGAHQGLIGTQMNTPVDASYLADAVILMRYFEARGEVRQAISIVKKRGGMHERTLREFKLENGAIRVGEALSDFRGVLTGVPVYDGDDAPLLSRPRGSESPRRAPQVPGEKNGSRRALARETPSAKASGKASGKKRRK